MQHIMPVEHAFELELELMCIQYSNLIQIDALTFQQELLEQQIQWIGHYFCL
jgi:hypothetical protein